MTHSADILILGGLPVTVEFTISGTDSSVGLFSSYPEDWQITRIAGRKVKKADWLVDRIHSRKGEEDRLLSKLNESLGDYYD